MEKLLVVFIFIWISVFSAAPIQGKQCQGPDCHEEKVSRMPEWYNAPRNPSANVYRHYIIFSVARTTNFGPVTESTVVPYDTIEVNEGDGFKSFNSEFRCPVVGYYWFSAMFRANSTATVELQYNNRAMATATATNGASASINMAVQMRRGDCVRVVLQPSIDGVLFSTSYKFLTFTGQAIAVDGVPADRKF